MPPGIQTPAAELADLANWLDALAVQLDLLAKTEPPAVVRADLKRHALNARGRAVLARTQLQHADQMPAGPETVYLLLRGDGAYLARECPPHAPVWTIAPARFARFTTEAEATAFSQAIPSRFLRGCSVSVTKAEYKPEPVPVVSTADHIAGSCEFCPVGGGGCGVCKGP